MQLLIRMAFVSVHALSAGTITLPERFFITPSDPDARQTVPSLCFLIQHNDRAANKTTRIVFDLGLRRDVSLYPQVLQKHCESRQPMSTTPDVVASLARGNIGVDSIDYVILSHVHYDHVGLPSDFESPNTKFIVGPGALDLLSGKAALDIGSHSHFESDLLPLHRTIELGIPSLEQDNLNGASEQIKTSWQKLAPFPHTIDFFQDGSVYIIDAPGHLPGHINLLCRLSVTPPKYVYLAGDACHDTRLFTGERDIATWTDDKGKQCCIHADIPTAKETLARIRSVLQDGLHVPEAGEKAEVEVVFAHDWAWDKDARKRGRFWPGRL